MYGPHLTLDLYGCEKKILGNKEFIHSFLSTCPDKIGMTKIKGPDVMQWLQPPHPDWGVSGTVIIAESHISVHTYPEKGFAVIDIFSCKNFDIEKTVKYIESMFKFKTCEKHLFFRGTHYPNNLEKSMKIVAAQRSRMKN
ncbi:MAG: adenosylmethionine decarboxylase [Candidatus Aenigmarchaeota archaeon]|nr:adenosylmethionine decarboxylase [Candidatus Aenigmarchaeota archaeon]